MPTPGADETRAECLDAARTEGHERLVLALRAELEVYNPTDDIQAAGSDRLDFESGLPAFCRSCWDSDALMHAYRSVSGSTTRRLSRFLLSVEAANAAAAERERMLEGRAKALLEAQARN